MDNKELKVQLGIEANSLLNNRVFISVLNKMELDLFNDFAKCSPTNINGLQEIARMQKTILKFKKSIKDIINDYNIEVSE